MCSATTPLRSFTPMGAAIDMVFDVRFIFQGYHRDLRIEDLPALLVPRKAKFGLIDYEKAFTADHRAGDIFNLRGIDRSMGCIVVVRPDQYVAQVLPLDAYAELNAYSSSFMSRPVNRN
jgi:phenol 2-monooxygenase